MDPAFKLRGGDARPIPAGAARNLAGTLSGKAEGRHLKRLVINPTLALNGKGSREPVKRFDMALTLPPNAGGLVRSSLRPTSSKMVGKRRQYRWNYANLFPVPMVLLYHTSAHALTVAKRLVSRKGKVAEIEIEIKNEGKSAVQGIKVQEVLFRADFKPARGERALVKMRAGKGHGWLLLESAVADLAPRQSRKLRYRVVVLARGASLKPTRVWVGKRLIALSNRLSLP